MNPSVAEPENLVVTPSVSAFIPTHILYITPHGGPFMKPAEAFDITSLVSSTLGTKDFHTEINEIIKNAVGGVNPPPILFTSTKLSRFSSSSTLSTPSNPSLGSITTPVVNTRSPFVRFSDDGFHPDIHLQQAMHNFGRAMSFVFNSREFKWKWGTWSPEKLVFETNGVLDVAARFFMKGSLQLGGVIAVDERRVDLVVAFATILICLKRERERRHF